jgi:hypothetical protein
VAFIGDWHSGFYRTISTTRGVFGDYIIKPKNRPVVDTFGDTQMLWLAGDSAAHKCSGGDCSALADYVPMDRSKKAGRTERGSITRFRLSWRMDRSSRQMSTRVITGPFPVTTGWARETGISTYPYSSTSTSANT